MSARILKGFAAVFGCLAIGTGVLLYQQLILPAEDPFARPVGAWSPELPESGVAEPGASAPGSFPQTFARPLFSPSRRPFVGPPPEAPPPVPEPEPPPPEPVAAPSAHGLTLKGILIGAATSRALIVSADQPLGLWIEPGAMIGGFTVMSIDADRVTLKSGDTMTEIKLYVDNRSN